VREASEPSVKFTVEMRTRGVDYARYLRAYFSDEFNRYVVPAANLTQRTLLEHVTLPDGKERRRMQIVPRLELPKFLLPILQGHTVRYEESMLFDPRTRRAQLEVHTVAGDRLRVSADAEFIELPDGVLMRIQCDAQVQLFGIGGAIERHLVKEVSQRYALVERALQRFLDEGLDLERNLSGA
jgi:hypothetical protein